jgi:glycerophosphoryl diester phosphodiesterase
MLKQSPFFKALTKPYNLAHQGGAALAPTNTMTAFALADTLGQIDFLDIDVHMSKDGHLVAIHDATVDRTTNGHGRVDELTLSELQQLDAGYHFQDVHGNYSYRGKGVRIPALEEVFTTYASKHYLHFEVKDAYPKNSPSQVEEKLFTLIQQFHMEQQVIVASFQQRIVDRFTYLSDGLITTGAGRSEVTHFVLAHKFHLPGLYKRKADILEIPIRSNGLNLIDQHLIDAAHSQGMEIYYWTVDDKATMIKLLTMGADGIFSDRPDILKEAIQEVR